MMSLLCRVRLIVQVEVALAFVALAAGAGAARALAAEDAGEKVVPLVVSLLSDKDKDVRSLGLQQVREEAKGAAATKEFAALLPKLEPDAQAALLNAPADPPIPRLGPRP